jgi:hypothetical protein
MKGGKVNRRAVGYWDLEMIGLVGCRDAATECRRKSKEFRRKNGGGMNQNYGELGRMVPWIDLFGG